MENFNNKKSERRVCTILAPSFVQRSCEGLFARPLDGAACHKGAIHFYRPLLANLFCLQENSGRNDKLQNDKTTSVVTVRIGIEVELNTFDKTSKMMLMLTKQDRCYTEAKRGSQSYSRPTSVCATHHPE